MITAEDLASSLVSALPQPWPAGRHDLVIRLEATQITGRMIHPNFGGEDTQ